MLPDAENITVAVVGLGLMGSSIASNFLIAGHHVIGIESMSQELQAANNRIEHHLTACQELDLLRHKKSYYSDRLQLTEDYAQLEHCDLVLECVFEDLDIKSDVISRIEKNVSSKCIIASNTSAIPISTLQETLRIPERFLGLHWSEPAYRSRFLEIINGAQTNIKIAQQTQHLATQWGKEAILVKKDIRGFVTNRLMYAVYREGLHLLEQGKTDLESLDKAFRYDTGSWMTMMGIFQRMDYVGIRYFATLAERTFGQLSNAEHVPILMRNMVNVTARGIHNQKGLYAYSQQESARWKEAFEQFSREIYQLPLKKNEPLIVEQEDIQANSAFSQILIIGEDTLSSSLAVCMAQNEQAVTWYTSTMSQGQERVALHHQDIIANKWPEPTLLTVTDQWPDIEVFDLVFIGQQLPVEEIIQYIQSIEDVSKPDVIIAVSISGVQLSEYQRISSRPENIIGVNWSEPVHTSYFMEIVANEITSPSLATQLMRTGKDSWNKDPYLIDGELGVQNKMMCALIREALFLVKNEYASPADIDRACRNDAGSYLPFAGNFRYMDLMGTYLYGVVMENLNKELSIDNTVLDILQKMLSTGYTGVEVLQGFYTYDEEDGISIDQKMRAFGFTIRQLMRKYMNL